MPDEAGPYWDPCLRHEEPAVKPESYEALAMTCSASERVFEAAS